MTNVDLRDVPLEVLYELKVFLGKHEVEIARGDEGFANLWIPYLFFFDIEPEDHLAALEDVAG